MRQRYKYIRARYFQNSTTSADLSIKRCIPNRNMKSTTILAGVAALASTVSAHATWQDLWVAGKDQIRHTFVLG
jgi:hypothetical protein